ncbi:TLR adapter interacting with SLC15A4 on the lysosome [Puntigrus tetrazona]|uniref:TLR adapter interacting with SLC15A4 on the lysosome n=1 Tax=Puntigrus tetrazona TaxID=1606681 RepID=UPI001C896C78|nr:TLR adapter interacting with SLC15A4 on the lysosome [Puntigrus tetrazona]
MNITSLRHENAHKCDSKSYFHFLPQRSMKMSNYCITFTYSEIKTITAVHKNGRDCTQPQQLYKFFSRNKMLCEGKLWSLVFEADPECLNPPERCAVTAPSYLLSAHGPHPNINSSLETATLTKTQQSDPHPSPLDPAAGRQLPKGVDIPRHADAPETEAFLVPSSCHSICQHYGDLHIAGGQVLPLSPSAADVQGNLIQDPQTGPFLLSGDVPSPSLLPPLVHEYRSSRRWREESGRERPSLLQFSRPLSNSQLNGYLEQKLLELYKQYLTEGPAASRPVMASELLQTSLDQMTLQLSREQNLETARAKDMLLSCLLRVTSSYQSSEISTPLLQISTETK